MEHPSVSDGSNAPLVFHDWGDTNNFRMQLLQQRRAHQYTDVILTTQGVQHHCHKVALSAGSEYFRAMFSTALKEASSDVIDLYGIDSDTLKCVLDYMYSGQIIIAPENVQKILQACEMYNLHRLKPACEYFMVEQLDPYNVLGFSRFAKMFNLSELRRASRRAVMKGFMDVIKGPEFVELTKEELVECIRDNDLSVPFEDPVLVAVLKWIDHNPGEREELFPDLLEHVRLVFCTGPYLDIMSQHPLVLSHPQSRLQFLEAIAYRNVQTDINAEKFIDLTTLCEIPRYSFLDKPILAVIGGGFCGQMNRLAWTLDEGVQTWNELTRIPDNRKFYSVCLLPDALVLTGAIHKGQSCLIYDLKAQTWANGPNLVHGRSFHSAVVHEGAVHVLGGFEDGVILDSVESLPLGRDTWLSRPPLSIAAMDTASVSFGESIYAFGGKIVVNGKEGSRNAQIFDTGNEKWTLHAEMPEACFAASAAVFNDCIFIVGGNTGACMSYDPRLDQWTVLSKPRDLHTYGSAVTLLGRIILAGGEDEFRYTSAAGGEREFVYSTAEMEEYDPARDEWRVLKHRMKKSLSQHCLVAIQESQL